MKNLKLIILAIIAGSINGMFSTGAGMILVPTLIYILNYDEYTARGTSMVIIFILCIVNLIIYSKGYSFELSMLPILIGGLIGNIVGNIVVYKINKKVLNFIFAFFTIIMGIGMII